MAEEGKSHPKITLTYWPLGGRTAAPRLAFAYADVPFTFVGIKFDEWAHAQADRKRFPLQDLPVLDVDGKVICESIAISNYAGRLSGTWPTDPLESARVAEIFLTLEEIYTGPWGTNLYKAHPRFNPSLTDDEVKALRQGPVTDTIKYYLSRINEIVASNDVAGFSVGGSFTIADFSLWYFCHRLASNGVEHISPDLPCGFPAIQAVVKNVESIDRPAFREMLKEVS